MVETKHRTPILPLLLILLAVVHRPALAEIPATAAPSKSLTILESNYPRVFFFRTPEIAAVKAPVKYEDWEKEYSRLMGMMVSVMDEELTNRLQQLDLYTRFKHDHPGQVMLLHFVGWGCSPHWQAQQGFFAGHWLYGSGAKIVSNLPAQADETVIAVSNAKLFQTNLGLFRNSPQDIALCATDERGQPDWRTSEQVVLLAVDAAANTIRVRRACYGTQPVALTAGKALAVPHEMRGPWINGEPMIWVYNYATNCPKDPAGRTCAGKLVDYFGGLFDPAGKLAAFDGLEFDVLQDQPGVIEFLRQLRTRLGEHRIIQADGNDSQNNSRGIQRAFGLLNGMESEGWPKLLDFQFTDWSGGLNRLGFWNQNARPPAFSYINHKMFTPFQRQRVEQPFASHRLVFAAAMFTDAAIGELSAPPADADGCGIWDEFRMGTGNRLGWLGKPLAPPVRMALRETNAVNWVGKLIRPPQGNRYQLQEIPCAGPDLFVAITARAKPPKGQPPEHARYLTVSLGGTNTPLMTWLNEKEFTAGFYFNDVRTNAVTLEIATDSHEPVEFQNITAHAHPDAIYREFEHGLVLANPSPRPYTFPLAQLFPKAKFRRLQATPLQDTKANDGTAVGATITLAPQEGLFLIRE